MIRICIILVFQGRADGDGPELCFKGYKLQKLIFSSHVWVSVARNIMFEVSSCRIELQDHHHQLRLEKLI